jgi:hypothetical protein
MNEEQKGAMIVLKTSLGDFLEQSSPQKAIIENLIKNLSEDPDTSALAANKLLDCCGHYMKEVGNYAEGDPDEMIKYMCGVFGSINLIEVVKNDVEKALNNMEDTDGK